MFMPFAVRPSASLPEPPPAPGQQVSTRFGFNALFLVGDRGPARAAQGAIDTSDMRELMFRQCEGVASPAAANFRDPHIRP